MKEKRQLHIHLYLSGRVIPGLVGTIMGLEGGLIIGGPGIIGMCPPIGGLIPGAMGEEKDVREELLGTPPSHICREPSFYTWVRAGLDAG